MMSREDGEECIEHLKEGGIQISEKLYQIIDISSRQIAVIMYFAVKTKL